MTAMPDRLATAFLDRYRLERELGAGGMATVFLAHDLKHDRDVAIKVLHPDLAAALGAERFLAEIKTTAKLQHPHILPLLDSGSADGLLYYVMPFVAGESLRDRLHREKQLPLDDAVRIAREVADALGHAHGHGIIHRDIKPENILLQGGHALVADFGIALAVSAAGGQRMTQTGLSLGTPQYMSPEQAMGEKALDARADIYALGAVTYEMLTGEPPFTGATVQAIVAKVLSDRPTPPSTVRDTVPPHVEGAVLTALAKMPADRFTSATAFAAALERLGAPGDRRIVPTGAGVRRWQAATGMLAAGLLAALAWGVRHSGADASTPIRTEFRVELTGGQFPVLAMAPDGSGVLYCRGGSAWIRRFSSLDAEPVGAEQMGVCRAADFSPDGRHLVILAAAQAVRILSVAGEELPRTLAVRDLDDYGTYGAGVDWADDGYLYIASRSGLRRVSPADGASTILARPDSQSAYFSVEVLPGARAALIVEAPRNATDLAQHRIGFVDLATGSTTFMLRGTAAHFAAPGWLLVTRDDGSLAALPFDARAGRATGAARRLDDIVSIADNRWLPAVAVSRDGKLVYWRMDTTALRHPVFVDREGNARAILPQWDGQFQMARLSPDESRFAVELVSGPATHVWIRQFGAGPGMRVTSDGTVNGRLSWSADGRSLTIVSDLGGSAMLYRYNLGDGSLAALPRYDARPVFGSAWSRDGRWLVLRTDDQAEGKGDIMAVRPGIDSVAIPVAASPQFTEYAPALSPDGRWLAYVSNESGQFEVWVTSFPSGAGKWQVTSTGASEPLWSHDGRELFFASEGYLVAASVADGPEFHLADQRRLFSLSQYQRFGPFNRAYDVSRDGRRFLMLRQSGEPVTRVVLVQNWMADLKREPR